MTSQVAQLPTSVTSVTSVSSVTDLFNRSATNNQQVSGTGPSIPQMNREVFETLQDGDLLEIELDKSPSTHCAIFVGESITRVLVVPLHLIALYLTPPNISPHLRS